MAFPTGWPPRQSPTDRPLRFFATATSTANFDDRAYLFGTDATGQPTQAGNVTPLPFVPHGAEAQVVSVPQVPWGGGRDVHDNTVVPMRFAGTITVTNDDSSSSNLVQISFDGTNVHGEVKGGETRIFRNRHEAGIAIRTKPASANCVFRVEAW